jgi:iron complex outermembrane receptor protein
MIRAAPARALFALLGLLASSAPAQVAQPTGDTDRASQPLTVTPVQITGTRETDALFGAARLDAQQLSAKRANTSDSARLLEGIPGVSTYGAGGISSLPVLHGLADDRLRTLVDGMDLTAACPNHMNPALSYIDPTKVDRVEVYSIAPVSAGGDSVGGTIRVRSAPPRFAEAEKGVLLEGQAGAFTRSNGNAFGGNIGLTVAGRALSFSFAQSSSQSENYEAAGDFKLSGIWQDLGDPPVGDREVAVSQYGGAQNTDLRLAFRALDNHLIELTVAEQRVGFQGFPNQRMDMVTSVPDPSDPTQYVLDEDEPANVNWLVNLSYAGQFPWGGLEARLFQQRLQHHMDMLQERFAGMYMPMDSEASTVGGLLKGSIEFSDTDLVRIGGDFQTYRLNDWWPPVGPPGSSMCCNAFWNIRDGERDRVGVFAEWERLWTPAWLSMLGVRSDVVRSDAGEAQGYNNSYSADANRFDAQSHLRTDYHLDLAAVVRFYPDLRQSYEAGIARRTRSPNLYERYAWSTTPMAALMNNFVGDGNGYIGDLDLNPEVAHTASMSADWHDPGMERWNLKLTVFYTYIRDFINAERYVRPGSAGAACNGTNMSTTNCYVILRYVNHDAQLYGFDISGAAQLGRLANVGSFSATGMLSYVRGEDATTGDNLYHIMPLNVKLALAHRLGNWTNTIEAQAVADKKYISQVRNEAPTPNYSLVDLRTSYEWKYARLDLAVENLFNQFYYLPLGGAYLGQGNSMTTNAIPWGMVVPGKARSFNAALTVRF